MPTNTARAADATVATPDADPVTAAGRWGKRLGVAAFVFFLVKGLAWLVVPAAAAYFASR